MTQKKLKQRIYAIYQFFTFIGMILIVIGMLWYASSASDKQIEISYWAWMLKDVLIFSNSEAVGVVASFVTYLGIGFLFLTYPTGWLILKVKDRNMFDRMFLMFVLVPVISNFLCLAAQLSQGSSKFTEEKLSREEIELHKTQILKTFNKNHKEIEEKTQEIKIQSELKKGIHIHKATQNSTSKNALKKKGSPKKQPVKKVKK